MHFLSNFLSFYDKQITCLQNIFEFYIKVSNNRAKINNYTLSRININERWITFETGASAVGVDACSSTSSLD